jgi:hypothetical protein
LCVWAHPAAVRAPEGLREHVAPKGAGDGLAELSPSAGLPGAGASSLLGAVQQIGRAHKGRRCLPSSISLPRRWARHSSRACFSGFGWDISEACANSVLRRRAGSVALNAYSALTTPFGFGAVPHPSPSPDVPLCANSVRGRRLCAPAALSPSRLTHASIVVVPKPSSLPIA